MGQKILYAIGLNGNYRRLREFVAACGQENIDRLLLAGPLFPSDSSSHNKTSALQKEFFETAFKPLLEDLVSRSSTRLLLHPGHTDLRHPTMSVVRRWCRSLKGKAQLVEDGTFSNVLDKPLMAYPYIPPTPNPIKDWEKWDKEGESIPDSFVKGFCSQENRTMAPVMLSPSHQGDTIHGDLHARMLGLADVEFILLTAGSPANTKLDLNGTDSHHGSHALREFITNTKPKLALHGHSLQSPKISGTYCEKLGPTLIVNPGQMGPESNSPSYWVSFDIDDLEGSLTHSQMGRPKFTGEA